ncbi:M23 family metallopeptidase [Microbacterium sp.]|uniref:M23 family metallopeptidase n=1 Tax=Microbacterium sp. TaxID=51671 RepID=UPI003F94C1CF
MRILAILVTGAALFFMTGCAGAPVPEASTSTAPIDDDFTPIVGSVMSPPQVAPATDGRVHVVYELLLGNALNQDVAVDSLTVHGDDGRELLTLASDDLAPWMRVVIDIAPSTPIPPMVSSPMTQTLAPTPVDAAEPIVIGPPLVGPGWLDGNSCCTVTPHRGAINPINGTFYVPERFAIDYVQLDETGRMLDGPADELSSYAYEGSDIIAVGDGPVVSMVWDLPEQTPGANPTGLTLAEYGGNHIVQDLGGGHYAFYAHLQPDNPMGLTVGQQLTKGEVIAHLGNSGNTDSPHLHFHVMDSPSPLASNGLAFRIDAFERVGTVTPADIEECITRSIPCAIDTSGASTMRDMVPLYGDVMDYPAP